VVKHIEKRYVTLRLSTKKIRLLIKKSFAKIGILENRNYLNLLRGGAGGTR